MHYRLAPMLALRSSFWLVSVMRTGKHKSRNLVTVYSTYRPIRQTNSNNGGVLFNPILTPQLNNCWARRKSSQSTSQSLFLPSTMVVAEGTRSWTQVLFSTRWLGSLLEIGWDSHTVASQNRTIVPVCIKRSVDVFAHLVKMPPSSQGGIPGWALREGPGPGGKIISSPWPGAPDRVKSILGVFAWFVTHLI